MDHNKLQQLRQKLDAADRTIVEALAERMAVVYEVDSLKQATGAARYDKTRWEAASKQRDQLAKELKVSPELVHALFEQIHEFILDDVYKMPRAFYLGPEGSFSNHALNHSVDLGLYRPVSCKGFADVWEQFQASPGALAVIPIENSITSNVHANVEILFEGHFSIIGEVYLNISLGLFARTGTGLKDIRSVYSHPQALAQAKKLLAKHGWKTHETTSTTAALQHLAKSEASDEAALAPLTATAEGLDCVLKDAQDNRENQTRFIVVSQTPQTDASGSKASLIVETAHAVGSLEKLLASFAKQQINLTKLESRPVPGKTWSYRFWIDLVLPEPTTYTNLKASLKQNKNLESFHILGLYQPGKTV